MKAVSKSEATICTTDFFATFADVIGRLDAIPDEDVQLYYLGDDPGETNNLETTHPKKVEALVDLLAKAMTDGRTTPGELRENDGWPMLQQEMIALFPQLGNGE